MHSAWARRGLAELLAFTAWGQPEIRQIGRALGRRPTRVRHNLLGLGSTSVLKMYARHPIWMWLSLRALPNPDELSTLTQIFNSTNSAPGGYSNYFLTGYAARGLKPLPISKDFSSSKNGWFNGFFRNFCKSGPISKGFSTSKMADFTIFFAIFLKWDPLLRIFDQNGTHV